MFYPTLKQTPFSESTISSFGGLDKSPIISENCFSFTQNTSSSLYPLLSTREKRLDLYQTEERPSALHTKNGISVVFGNILYFNGVPQHPLLDETTPKQIVSMGSLLIVFPDGVYINTSSLDKDGVAKEFGSLSARFELADSSITIFPYILGLGVPKISVSAPNSTANGELWLDTSETPNRLCRYSSVTGEWAVLAPTHVRIESPSISDGFDIGDGIVISGLCDGLDGSNMIAETGEGYIVISGNIDSYTVISPSQALPFSLSRHVPKMDFVCEHENRLWGCRYGTDVYGNKVNEIYASKLGDPCNWNVFAGLSTDSYTASCGSEGCFTGVTSHLGYVVFFKENHIHRLFGTKPQNFKLYDDLYPGVKKGSERSLALLSGTLYYHSPVGICAYSGNSPTVVSRVLGDNIFTDAVGAVAGNKYYVCLYDGNDAPSLFVFDVYRGIWHREDNFDCIALASIEQDVLAIKKNSDNTYTLQSLIPSKLSHLCSEIYGKNAESEKDFEWCAQTGLMGLKTSDNKYISTLRIRLEAEKGASLSVFAEYDSSGIWENVGTVTSSALKSAILPITPKRCDHFKLRFSGKGSCKIYSLTKRIERASEVG